MRTILSLIALSLLFNSCTWTQTAQNNTQDEQAVSMLKEFYIAHSNIWSMFRTDIPLKVVGEKLDSLAEKYCTLQLRIEAKKYLENGGFDVLTDERGISKESLTSMEITKDITKKNIYIVSYYHMQSSPAKLVKCHVFLYVKVVKEDYVYKIDSVTSRIERML